MASVWYAYGASGIMNGSIDLDTSTLKALLVMTLPLALAESHLGGPVTSPAHSLPTLGNVEIVPGIKMPIAASSLVPVEPANGRAFRLPPLRVSVRHIVGVSTEEQVGRIHARPVIAPMTNMKSVWDRAIGRFPHPSVGGDCYITDGESAVPAFGICRPQPAGIRPAGAVNLRPEALLYSRISARRCSPSTSPALPMNLTPASSASLFSTPDVRTLHREKSTGSDDS